LDFGKEPVVGSHFVLLLASGHAGSYIREQAGLFPFESLHFCSKGHKFERAAGWNPESAILHGSIKEQNVRVR
jgi:hypothetical protein